MYVTLIPFSEAYEDTSSLSHQLQDLENRENLTWYIHLESSNRHKQFILQRP